MTTPLADAIDMALESVELLEVDVFYMLDNFKSELDNLRDRLKGIYYDVAFLCLDCNVHTFESNDYYMVHDSVWYAAVPDGRGMLCIICLEKRIGRSLTAADFPDVPANDHIISRYKELAKQ